MKVRAVVEIPRGSRYKFEVEKSTDLLVIDRVLTQQLPEAYGFFEKTLFADGDPTDMFLICNDPVPPLTRANVEIQRIIFAKDGGIQDDKIVATLPGEVLAFGLDFYINDLLAYLSTYKEGFVVERLGSREEAIAAYEKSREAYKSAQIKSQEGTNKQLAELANKTFLKYT